ncbi:dehydrodolichyl diphosphate synthase 2-like protein [Tanacetum coccineum]
MTCGTSSLAIVNTETDLDNKDEQSEELPKGLIEELLPKHIGFIVDGNRRWAKQRGWSGKLGHNAGRMILVPLLRLCCKLKIKVVSFFVFSTENWSRPTEEVDFLMKVIADLLTIDGEELLARTFTNNLKANFFIIISKMSVSFNKVFCDLSKLEPLDGTNYKRWSQKLLIFFEQLEIDYVLSQDAPENEATPEISIIPRIGNS